MQVFSSILIYRTVLNYRNSLIRTFVITAKILTFDAIRRKLTNHFCMLRTSILLFLANVLSVLVTAQNSAQWRGANRDGIYEETNLLKIWPEEGLKLLWSYDQLGKGHSSPIVTDEMVYIPDQKDSTGYACALDLNGQMVWKVPYGTEWHEDYPGVRSTFTYYKNKLYISTAYSVAICLDATNGQKLWEVDLKKEFGSVVPKFGKVESPLILDGKVIFTAGGDSAAMVALNPENGETIWRSAGIEDQASYCSPQLLDVGGKKLIVNAFIKALASFDGENGEFLWKYPQVNKYGNHCNTPIFHDGHLYSFTGYGGGGIMLRLEDGGRSVSKVWQDSLLDNQMGGAILYQSMIVGSGHNNKSWYVLDWKTGEVKFTSKAIGVGVVIFADDHFYCYSDKGDLGLMKLTDEGLELVSKMKITLGSDQHWSHPVIRNGVLYLRHGDTLMAYSVKE